MSFHGDLLRNHRRLLRLFNDTSGARPLRATKILHAIAFASGSVADQTLFLQNNVLFMYASLGELSTARKLFDQMPQRNSVSFNTLIGAYGRLGRVEEAWEMFSEMRRGCGLNPTQFTFAGLMGCAELDIRRGVQLQACVVKNGLFCSNAFVGTVLSALYGRLGFIDEAVRAFEDMPCKSLVTWNSLLSLLGHHGLVGASAFLFRDLMRIGDSLSECSLLGLLSGVSSWEDRGFGEQVHGLIVKLGLASDVKLSNSLINMYFKCVGVDLAEKVLEEMTVRDVVTWNSIIGAVSRSFRPETAFELFRKMSVSGVFPNSTTYFNLVVCCITMGVPFRGETVHAKVIQNGLQSDVFVGTALVDFYSKCDDLEGSHCCFREICEPSTVSWNTLIIGYSKKRSSTPPVFLLREMIRLCHRPNEFTFSIVLKSLTAPELWQVHCLTIRTGYQDNGFVLSSLITSYAKNDLVTNALAFVTASDNNNSPLLTVPTNISAGIYNRAGRYDETLLLLSLLDDPDLVSWNIVIEACARRDYHEEAFELFREMNVVGVRPDNFTFASLLRLCAAHRDLASGSSIHSLVLKTGSHRCDSVLCNVLIDMYRKCGSVASTARVFDEAGHRDLAAWTTLISALGLNGHAREALERFREMESAGVIPDGPAVNAALSACQSGGLVREGTELFRQMKTRFGIEPETPHYRNLVELLMKTGHTMEADKVISEMRYPQNRAYSFVC